MFSVLAVVDSPIHSVGRPTGLISVISTHRMSAKASSRGRPWSCTGSRSERSRVSPACQEGVQLDADLQSGPVTGLTNTMDIDFRPVNYFGVTGINLSRGTVVNHFARGADQQGAER